MNTGDDPIRLPRGEVLLSSAEPDGELPGNSTVWMRPTDRPASGSGTP